MNRILLILLLSGQSLATSAQMIVTVNNEKIKPNQVVAYDDNLKTIEIGFENGKKIPAYSNGVCELKIEAKDNFDKFAESWTHELSGYSAIADFLYSNNVVMHSFLNETTRPGIFTPKGSGNLRRTCNDMLRNAKVETLNITVSLKFYEKTGYDSYGSAIEIVDNFKFVVDLKRGETELVYPGLNASLNFKNVAEYIGNHEEKQQYVKGFGESVLRVKFTDFFAQIYSINTGDKSQDALVQELTTSFYNYINTHANYCNSVKIKKSIAPPDSREWQRISGFGAPAMMSGETTIDSYIPLDQLNNLNFSSVKVFEKVTLNELSGFRFSGLIHKTQCVERGITSSNDRSEPSQNKIMGSSIIYVLNHPVNKSQVLMLVAENLLATETQNTLENRVKILDNYLANIIFKK